MKYHKIGIIGLGYVGLPLALRFSEEGFCVTGFDVDEDKVRTILSGQSYIKHLGHETVARALQSGLSATTDFSQIAYQDALIICVPTPLNKNREPDLSFIVKTMESAVPFLRRGQLVSLESTTYPGTTEEILKPMIENQNFSVGTDIHLVYSPEREDPGNKKYTTKTIPKVIGGCTEACLTEGVELYSAVIDRVVPVSSTRAAELAKLLENIHRAVNIGLVNEMKIIADKMGIDIYEVIEAAATKPFGFVPYFPGPGLGGHCIPIDPFYLTWKAREYGLNTRFIELAGEVNRSMPEWVVEKATSALNSVRKSVSGSRILILGIAYKKNVDDMRESPAVEIMEILKNRGAVISYSDPWVPVFPKMREYCFELNSIDLKPDTLEKFDLVIVATDHDNVDYSLVEKHSQLIIDTRRAFKTERTHILKA
jgi:UDP-N-acetyl-D-glucosamine dehydrogenase